MVGNLFHLIFALINVNKMVKKKRAMWLMLVIDGYLGISLDKFKLLVNSDDKKFLDALKAFNNRCNDELNICYELKNKHKHIILPFLEKNSIEDGFNIKFIDSPNFDKNVYNDYFIQKSKLTLYSSQLILGK